MNIRILQLAEGARNAKGIAVIIDVFRAMTVEAWIMNRGAEKLYPVGDKELAYQYKKEHPDAVLIGERGGVMLPGFDYGNSPSQIKKADLTGKTVLHTTSAGTQGIACAAGAEEILTGSLVNAAATAEYIRMKDPGEVSLVCMGLDAVRPIEEDTLCAEYIRSLLLGRPIEMEDPVRALRKTSGAKFFDPAQQSVFPEEDFHLSTELNRFSFVLKAVRESDGMQRIRRIDLPHR